MKNIILCSDGTGNSGGKVNGTNVWRIYEAIDRQSTLQQTAFYDDGVGTESWKPLKLLGGATGYGLTRNVTKLYTFLIQNYNPGDQIFLFGFSRGAFTVRVLANILFHCGIADRGNLTPTRIGSLAVKAIAAYKKRAFNQPDVGAPKEFREMHGLDNPGGEKGRFPLRFVGVWDTVEAYGLPIDELTDALPEWVLPLQFRERDGVRENDLHSLIENACQALSTDDERHTFHPILWYEGAPLDPLTGAEIPGTRERLHLDDGTWKRRPGQTIEQVWFAGMHANVGGGYPQDALSHVPLVWMMQQAKKCGLRFDPALEQEYARTADIDGKQYDSRSGVGVYYRYRPRDLRVICAGAGIRTAKVHAAVLERIANHAQEYAPTGVPPQSEYHVVGLGFASESDTHGRMQRQAYVDDLIWQGRCLYFVFILWTIALVVTALGMRGKPAPDVGAWDPIERFLYALQRPVIDVVIWMIPSYFQSGLVALRNSPYVLSIFVLTFFGIFKSNRVLDDTIRQQSNLSWQTAFGQPPADAAVSQILPVPRHLRTSPRVNAFANFFYRRVVPKLAGLAMIVATAAILFWWGYPACQLARQCEVQPVELAEHDERVIDFDTANAMQVTNVYLHAGVKYRITAEVEGPSWRDGHQAATPDGLVQVPPRLAALEGFRRVKDQPWFKLMGSIGPDEDELIPIGKGRDFWAARNGRLYLFVNDAPGKYGNNSGKAKVTVKRLVN